MTPCVMLWQSLVNLIIECFSNYIHLYPLQSKTSTPVQDLPPPPAMTEGDDEDYYDSGAQQVRNETQK